MVRVLLISCECEKIFGKMVWKIFHWQDGSMFDSIDLILECTGFGTTRAHNKFTMSVNQQTLANILNPSPHNCSTIFHLFLCHFDICKCTKFGITRVAMKHVRFRIWQKSMEMGQEVFNRALETGGSNRSLTKNITRDILTIPVSWLRTS